MFPRVYPKNEVQEIRVIGYKTPNMTTKGLKSVTKTKNVINIFGRVNK